MPREIVEFKEDRAYDKIKLAKDTFGDVCHDLAQKIREFEDLIAKTNKKINDKNIFEQFKKNKHYIFCNKYIELLKATSLSLKRLAFQALEHDEKNIVDDELGLEVGRFYEQVAQIYEDAADLSREVQGVSPNECNANFARSEFNLLNDAVNKAPARSLRDIKAQQLEKRNNNVWELL
jgi:hypothetical protein